MIDSLLPHVFSNLNIWFFLSVVSWDPSPFHLKEVVDSSSLAYPNCQPCYSYISGLLLNKIMIQVPSGMEADSERVHMLLKMLQFSLWTVHFWDFPSVFRPQGTETSESKTVSRGATVSAGPWWCSSVTGRQLCPSPLPTLHSPTACLCAPRHQAPESWSLPFVMALLCLLSPP